MSPKLLPASIEEAFEVFTAPNAEDDAPRNCHNHCDCYWGGEPCHDCGEQKGPISRQAVPVEEFLAEQAKEHPAALTFGGLSWDYDSV